MLVPTGGFTIPGEAGYEDLTRRLAAHWGADGIRDSDGTTLSEELLRADFEIYSTICIIREHNAWIEQNPHCRQQTFLCTPAQTADDGSLVIILMAAFFDGQFTANDTEQGLRYWQVYDRTANMALAANEWYYDRAGGQVTITAAIPFHRYSVSFLAYRVWEEISMYNHTTNGWQGERLGQLDPRYPEARAFLREYLHQWCVEHPHTDVVRFTSLFYNFAWIWGSDDGNRHLFTDWASYDFSVSDLALAEFEAAYAYALTAEDFVNGGHYQATHMPPTQEKLDWMAFIHDFVVDFAKELVAIVHDHGKKAFLFYDDSWVGVEPYGRRFGEIGFDGLIKCAFCGFEARLCAAVDVPVHELRLHPYLFPVGLGGAPTFAPGGDPARDAREYWLAIRRALPYAPIERIGLGGYLHLAEGQPDFCEMIKKIGDEFRLILALHQQGRPYMIKTRVAILHCWGRLRSWTTSGHFHETAGHDLIHIIEALSGLPIEVSFISFADVREGALAEVDVVINAGRAGDAWSGGEAWRDAAVVSLLTEWVNGGGTFIGVGQPSAAAGYDSFYRMAHVLGVDEDRGARVCHGRWRFTAADDEGIVPSGAAIAGREGRFLTDGRARVLMADGDSPSLAINHFGAGRGIYLSSFQVSAANTRLLFQLIVGAEGNAAPYMSDDPEVECVYYAAAGKLLVLNNAGSGRSATVKLPGGAVELILAAYGMEIVEI